MQNLNKEVDGGGSDEQSVTSTIIAGPDRSQIQLARKRFESFSKQRLSRLHSLLLPAQRQFLSLLPVLFHANHPLLPGYGNANTPIGIEHFHIDSGLKKRIEKYFFGLKLDDDKHKIRAIQSMFLIGSSGTLAQSHKSDLDCWLCFSEALSQKAEEALQKKCAEISQWAKKFRLELHFFIMHRDSFRSKRKATTGGEDCGGTQHFLLLDEFYRTGILIAGRAPTWWVVPSQPQQENDTADVIDPINSGQSLSTDYKKGDSFYEHFSKQIVEGKFVKGGQFIDFGDTGVIPISEYLSASVWTLYKAVQSPYKSVIKLLLIETYLAQRGRHRNLSEQLKHIIHTTNKSIEGIDPYIQIYEHIERYLNESKQTARLEFLRECFYHKVDIKLSQSRNTDLQGPANNHLHAYKHHDSKRDAEASTIWRQTIMSDLVSSWGWSNQQCRDLENQQQQSMGAILDARKALSNELLSTYRYIDHVAQEALPETNYHEHRYSQELQLLEQQLKVVYRHCLYKIGYRAAKTDAKLSVAPWKFIELRQPGQQLPTHESTGQWQLPNHGGEWKNQRQTDTSQESKAIIKTANTLEELIIWSMQEGLACSSTEFYCRNSVPSVYSEQLRTQLNLNTVIDRVTRALRGFYYDGEGSQPLSIVKENKALVDKCLILVNADPEESTTSLWDQVVLSSKDDPLAYTGRPRNEIRSLSLIWSNTWGELFTTKFIGHNAIQCALAFYLKLARTRCCNLDMRCISNERPRAITQRLRQLFVDITHWDESARQDIEGAKPQRHRAAFVFSTADGIYLIANPQDKPNDSKVRDYWAFSKSVSDIRADIEMLWQPHYDPLSFHALEAVKPGRAANQ